MAEAQGVETVKILKVNEREIKAQSWTGFICKGTWGGIVCHVRVISITDCRSNFLTHYEKIREKYDSHTFRHDNVLKVYYHDICPQGIHRYLVLEDFDLTLTQYCDLVPISVEVIPRDIDALRQMVDGLLYIHGKDFIHGAINPDNILICRSNAIQPNEAQITLKISDFGLHVNQIPAERGLRFQHCNPIYWTIINPYAINVNSFGMEVGPDIIDLKESFYNDIFGMGCTLFYFLKHTHPFLDCVSENRLQVLLNIQQGTPTKLKSLEGHVAFKPIRDMINNKPPIDGRPTMLIASTIFRDYLTINPCKYKQAKSIQRKILNNLYIPN